MTALAALQAQFWRAARGDLAPADLAASFVSRGGLSVAARMRIYQHAYWARQERVLGETFPRFRAIVGGPRFHALAIDYLKRYPSDRPAIEWIGRRFAQALAARGDLPAYLVDLSELEWARMEVLLAPDASAVAGVEALRGLDLARARSELCPSVRLLRVHPQALQVWAKQDAPIPEGTPRLGCVVWRHAQRARHRALAAAEYEALRRLAAGDDFAGVCAAFSEPDAAQAAARAIGGWLRDGLLASLHAHGGDRRT